MLTHLIAFTVLLQAVRLAAVTTLLAADFVLPKFIAECFWIPLLDTLPAFHN